MFCCCSHHCGLAGLFVHRIFTRSKLAYGASLTSDLQVIEALQNADVRPTVALLIGVYNTDLLGLRPTTIQPL
jgi:hypothetical protein